MNRQSKLRNRRSRALALLAALLSLVGLSALAATPALASPGVKVGLTAPEYIQPESGWVSALHVQNLATAPLQGNLTVRYTLPSGLVPFEPIPFGPQGADFFNGFACNTMGQVVECTADATGAPSGAMLAVREDARVEATVSGSLHGSIEVEGPAVGNPIVEPLDLTVGDAPFALKSLDVETESNPFFSASQAGAVPEEIDTTINILSQGRSNFDFPQSRGTYIPAPSESLRDVVTHLPPGLIGNPAVSRPLCTPAQLNTLTPRPEGGSIGVPPCPLQSQVGLFYLPLTDSLVPLWNVVPPRGYPAALGFWYYNTVTYLLPKLRPSDNGIDVVVKRSSNSIPLPRTEAVLWGVPADPSHANLRGTCLDNFIGYSPTYPCPFNGERKAFLRNPTSCPGTPLGWEIELDSFQHPGTFIRSATTTPAMEGCEKLPFDPSVSMAPTERVANSPSGLDVQIAMPQSSNPDGLAEADMKAATVVLPKGVTLNPASADGLAACSDEQLRLGLEGPSECPDASKLGTLELTTPLLEDPIEGSVYLRSQASQDPASGDLYRVALEIRSDERGVQIKLPGSLKVDPDTGRLTTSFDDLPQLPFESMRLHLKSGPRAPLTTPSSCGTYAAHAEFTGWNGKSVSFDPSFEIDQGCASTGFKPGFEAGAVDNTAGDFSPFTLRVTRDDGQPNISRIDATLPPGELAKLAGVGICPEGGAVGGTCPASSLLGSTTVGAGTGPDPLYLPQPGKAPTAVYLAGPYKGGPYSLVVKVPAQAGPFDLGTVAVRSAIEIDPTTTQVSVLSDPLPQIVGGVPVSYRDVRVNVDRPSFSLNPTSCEPHAVTGTIASNRGDVAHVSDRFQASDCASLGFKPRLALALKGAVRRGANPALTATLHMPKGANVARASVALPHSAFLDQSHIKTICTRVQFAADGGGGAGCPAGSVYGHARAFTPLLDRPLEGPVYLRSSNHNLPDLVASLDGAIHVDLSGRIDSFQGGIRTSFEAVPDAPVTKFVLAMQGGKKGLIQNSRNLCGSTSRADAKFDGQNGRAHDFRPLVKPTSCADTPRKKHRRG